MIEAGAAESKKDFMHELAIALKELRESHVVDYELPVRQS